MLKNVYRKEGRGIKEIVLLMALFFSVILSAQETADDFYAKARKLAFDDKNYPEAIVLTKQALIMSPEYDELNIFLGRLYTWNKETAKARAVFTDFLEKHPDNEDAFVAYGNLEFWDKKNDKALEVVNKGLKKFPNSERLLLLKAQVLNETKNYYQADEILIQLLKINPENDEAKALQEEVKKMAWKNAVGVNYDYVYFDKRFEDAWHLASADYTRQGAWGSVTGRVNYANRFATNALQFEVDAYPRINNMFYGYLNGGISDNEGIFPQYRAGASLNANLPKAFEAELGIRMLSFNGEETWSYVGAVGKYYANWWFNFRTYITPDSDSVTSSFMLTTRYYLGGADDYLSLRLGTGISPDDPSNNILYNNAINFKQKSTNAGLEYRKTFAAGYIGYVRASLDNQEYAPDTKGNQISAGIGAIKRF